jgi:hypothetical protein
VAESKLTIAGREFTSRLTMGIGVAAKSRGAGVGPIRLGGGAVRVADQPGDHVGLDLDHVGGVEHRRGWILSTPLATTESNVGMSSM